MSTKTKQSRPPREPCPELPVPPSVNALINGDEATFCMLVERYQTSMLHLALRYVADIDTAADVVQETWLAVIRGVQRFEGRAAFQTWLFTILVNRARTCGKKEKRQISFSAWQGNAVEIEDDGDRRMAVHDQWGREKAWPRFLQSSIRPPEEEAISRELRWQVEVAIEQLPEQQRQVITLHDLEGWTNEEICALLHLNAGNQRVLLYRARAKVRRVLLDYLEQLV